MPENLDEELAAQPGEVEVEPVRGPGKARKVTGAQFSQSRFEAFALPVPDELVFLSMNKKGWAECGGGEQKR